MEWSKQNTIEICKRGEAYQVQTTMSKGEMVSKQAKKTVKIARLNIPHTFLVGKIAPNCILGSNFLEKIFKKVDFKGNELQFYQGG